MDAMTMAMKYGGQPPNPQLIQRQADKRKEKWRRRFLWLTMTVINGYYLWKGVYGNSNPSFTYSTGTAPNAQTYTFTPGQPLPAGQPPPTPEQFAEAQMSQAAANDLDSRVRLFIVPFFDGIANELAEWLGTSDLEEHFIQNGGMVPNMMPNLLPAPATAPATPTVATAQTGLASGQGYLARASANDPAVYYIQGGKKYHVSNPDVANRLVGTTGNGWYSHVSVNPSIAALPEGPAISQ